MRYLLLLLFFVPLYGNPIQEPLADRVITTLPKSGTHFFDNLRKELQVDVAMCHFALNTPDTWSWWGKIWPSMLRKPEEFSGKTVILVRDLRDMMPSAVFWLIGCSEDILNHPEQHDEISLKLAREYLDATYDEKLLKTIRLEGMAQGFMTFVKYSCDLTTELLKKSSDSIFVIHFEDAIGQQAGGRLKDPARDLLLRDMFRFLGFSKSTEEIAAAVERAFGHSRSYNPVTKKVGRWESEFQEIHKQAFLSYWERYNQAFGYDSTRS